MKGLKKQRRIQIIVLAVLAMAGALAAFKFAMPDALQYFRSPTEVIASPPSASETFRIGGLVEDGSLVRGEGAEITFRVTDGNGVVPVSYTGLLPDLFGEGEGVVATGKLVGGTFEANEILAKHDETYMPKEVIDALKEQGVYVEPDAGAATN
ncbi:cytochrome c maturation protein CcmE [Defluviimonas sp. WL0075]|uniref:Cytochrome c-type biogenesis protein CcmE n=1 Tax=Albidovulum sediminicola TaxID=2984331 RepID=A0ABT2YZF8_9RHOB|nr:cytochrome c maturation protein CcmE [Defluviimonas sp. WL0075]MCV2864269.1 cytochrome c maturation protein CcmE [Defluviimonas sp. WL0075]